MKTRLLLAAAFVLLTPTLTHAQTAPKATAATMPILLQPWTGPHGGVPPWDKVTPDACPPAFEQAEHVIPP